MTYGFTHEVPVEGATHVWLTPPDIIRALGPFDLDPCAVVDPRPWSTALRHIAPPQDGLSSPWSGFVWCNPPYGPHTGRWLARLATHPEGGIALVFARTETKMFFEAVYQHFSAMLFIKGRIQFYRPTGVPGDSAGAPSVLIAYGAEAAKRLSRGPIEGFFVRNDGTEVMSEMGQGRLL